MYSYSQLQSEIATKIARLIDQRSPTLEPEWITQAVMLDHPDVQGNDADFHLCCSRVAVRKEVTQQINKTDSPLDESPQLTLDGFVHLQQYYVVMRDKVRIGVSIDEMTGAELDAKADAYDAMGRKCAEHADEIRRYKLIRGGAARSMENGDVPAHV